ncbi:siderophore-interacting protein [Nakamurella flavida]|uniref:Siderophore-interacting protein n=1 Tax=Nakamurella flavida TaxID=363630 RepID=A0A938YK73_9ACTN|nr:siderophore-interacting protein [Nakamurella flavida]MBM9476066.1 siderophore-interacting protein [Nakamurella flavida]MDP9777191.1 NADPH-dependent ferric siderophore reductase [Nakamurella flavida]
MAEHTRTSPVTTAISHAAETVSDGARTVVAQAVRRLPAVRRARSQGATAVLARVTRVQGITPAMARVTFTAPEFADSRPLGSDHYVRLLLPRPGQDELVLPRTAEWYPELVAMAPKARPVLRNYTVREVRPEVAEMDIDFVRHGDSGPATRWVNRAEPGMTVGIIDQGVIHEVEADRADYLIVGDETALPAAAGILAALPSSVRARVLLEVPSESDRQELPTAADADVRYLVRPDAHCPPGSLLPGAVAGLEVPAGTRCWVSGESAMSTQVRRCLVRQHGVPKDDVCFTGYFKYGSPAYAE